MGICPRSPSRTITGGLDLLSYCSVLRASERYIEVNASTYSSHLSSQVLMKGIGKSPLERFGRNL